MAGSSEMGLPFLLCCSSIVFLHVAHDVDPKVLITGVSSRARKRPALLANIICRREGTMLLRQISDR